MCCCFLVPVFDGGFLDMTSSPAESAVRAADRESPETERQRTGTERPEEGDGCDEGRLEEFYFRFLNPKILMNPCTIIV